MVFDGILGQEPAVLTLRRALEAGRVHHAYRFEGPPGVGKEKAAFALAQSLVCTQPGAIGCGQCSACRRAVSFTSGEPRVPQHPDVVLIERGLYPPETLGSTHRETAGIGVEQIRRVVLGRAEFAPHEGKKLVFIVREAHELTVQAANALLKTLEEPRVWVHFVLVTSQPNRLLETVLSRTLAVRFGPLSDDLIATILRQHDKPAELAALAQGSAATALSLADPEQLEAREAFARAARQAIEADDLAEAVRFAGSCPNDRHVLKAQLFFYAQRIALEARERVSRDPAGAARLAHRHGLVLSTIEALELNAQPTLAVEGMLARMRAI